jgi:predicted ribosome quality control (RQC) complex YloA/Tae2 family protein
MALNRLEIERVLAEIAPILRGGWIQKIQQPTPDTLVLDVRVPGQTLRLLISSGPDTSRLHLTSHPFKNPPTPPALCQFLRAHFQGARINDICQVPNDRIVEIHCACKAGTQTIVCELIGKKANILVLDAGRLVLRDLANQRDLVGQPYAHPAQRETYSHTARSNRFTGAGGDFPISAEIDAYYRDKESTLAIDHAKEARLRVLRNTLKKERRRIDAWREDLAKAVTYCDYARYGELIKANLGTIAKGTDHITIADYFDERLPEVTIPLDRTKSPHGNMDDYFRKHRKYVAAERELKPRIEQAERELERFRAELSALEQGTWTPPAASPSGSSVMTRIKARNNRLSGETQRRGPFRRFISADGLPIFVGRNARENDELTFGLAKSDDLWLHARGTPGSHVVVRLEKGTDPPLETLRDAGTLALLYSDLKKSGKGDVIYTRRKWVKKAKGQAPGAVTVTQEKSLYLSLDKRRLDALKTRSTQE